MNRIRHSNDNSYSRHIPRKKEVELDIKISKDGELLDSQEIIDKFFTVSNVRINRIAVKNNNKNENILNLNFSINGDINDAEKLIKTISTQGYLIEYVTIK